MFNGLKRKLRKWLAEDEPPSMVLDVVVGGEVKKVVVISRIGMRLKCSFPTPNGIMEELIPDNRACDPKHFWKLWKQLGGHAQWEDGSTFTPPV